MKRNIKCGISWALIVGILLGFIGMLGTASAAEESYVSIALFNTQRNVDEVFILDFTADYPEQFRTAHFTMAVGADVTFQEAVFHNAAEGSYVDNNKATGQLTVHLEGDGKNDKLIASLIFKPDSATNSMTYTVLSTGLSIAYEPPVDVTLPTTAQTVTTAAPAYEPKIAPAAPKEGETITVTIGEADVALYVFDELNNRTLAGKTGVDGAASLDLAAGYYQLIAVTSDKNSSFTPLIVNTADNNVPASVLVPNVTIPKEIGPDIHNKIKAVKKDEPYGMRIASGLVLYFDENGQEDDWPTRKYEIYRFDNTTTPGELTGNQLTGTIYAGVPHAARNDHESNFAAFEQRTTTSNYNWFNIHNPYTYVVLPIDNRGRAGPAATIVIDSEHNDQWKDQGLFEKSANQKREQRAQWFETVSRWPNGGKNEANGKRDLIAFLDACVKMGTNVVYFQCRYSCATLYYSKLQPTSTLIANAQGDDPGWDPLAFMVEECHKRNIECHAWINPFICASPSASQVGGASNSHTNDPDVPRYLSQVHPEWLCTAANTIFDPGIPEARRWLEDCLLEIVENYDVDGLHFDDFFYQEANDDFGGYDRGTNSRWKNMYGKTTFETFNTMEDINGFYTVLGEEGMGYTEAFPNTPEGYRAWRYNNIDMLIKELRYQINALKPWVQFSISPGGIYANNDYFNGASRGLSLNGVDYPAFEWPADPVGSDTHGGAPLKYMHGADVLKWVKEGWLDSLVPQVYWSTGYYPTASFCVLTEWWRDTVNALNPDCVLSIGVPVYKLNNWDGTNRHALDEYFFDTADIDEHGDFNGSTAYPGVPDLKKMLRMVSNMEGVWGTVPFTRACLHNYSGTSPSSTVNNQSGGSGYLLSSDRDSLTVYGLVYADEYALPAIPPVTISGKKFEAPDKPAVSLEDGVITIIPAPDTDLKATSYYMLYAFDNEASIDLDNPAAIVAKIRGEFEGGYSALNAAQPVSAITTYAIPNYDADNVYVLTALDRMHNESASVALSDKTALTAAIAAFEALAEKAYTRASWAAAQPAYEAAVIVNNDADVFQAEVDAAADQLIGAMDLLEAIRLNLASGQAPSFVIRKNMITQIKLDTNAESLTYTSSNSAIVTVTPDGGVVTGKSIGVAVVQIKDINTGYVINLVVNCTN